MFCHNLKVIILSFLVLSNHPAFCRTSSVEVTSYDIRVKFDSLKSQLRVFAEVELQKPEASRKFEMLLSSDVRINSIKSKMNHDWIQIPSSFEGKDTLLLVVPPELASNKKLTIDFEYTLSLDESKEVMTLFRGHRWYPLILDQIAPFKLTTEVPHGFGVFSAGELVQEKGFKEFSQFVWESKIPVFKLPLIIAKSDLYEETIEDVDGKKVYLYSSTIDEETKKKVISEAGRTLQFYDKFIGEYPYNRLTLVEVSELQGANIASAFVMFGSTSFAQFKKGYYESLHLSIATQWIAAGVFFKLFGKGFWFFQLSLPHYLRLMYLERAKGKEAFVKGLQRGLDAYKEIVGTKNDVAILDVDFPNTKEKSRVIYGKGPYIIDKLRKRMGDENWKKFLQGIYKDFKGRILDYNRFISYLFRYDQDGTCVSRLEKMLSEKGLPE